MRSKNYSANSKKIEATEHQEQTFFISWCAVNEHKYPGLELIHHTPNEGRRSVQVAAMLKAEGMKSGVPDLCLPVARNGYHGLYIEMKRASGGKLSANQKKWIEDLRRQGYAAEVAKGADEAIEIIKKYYSGDNNERI